MTGLVLKLGPKERILINGAVIENGDRRARFTVVTPNANILRLKDAIHPDHADTPVKYACFLTQLLLSGDVDVESVKPKVLHQIRLLGSIFNEQREQGLLAEAVSSLDRGSPYCCLKSLRQLLPIETMLLERATG